MAGFEGKKELSLDEAIGTVDMIQKVMDRMGTERRDVFIAFMGMLMEEYCYRNDLNVVEEAETLMGAVKQVNDEMGKYEPDRIIIGDWHEENQSDH